VVEYGFDFLQLIESVFGYARQFFDVSFNQACDTHITTGILQLTFVVSNTIRNGC
jgi:hypothetical protein